MSKFVRLIKVYGAPIEIDTEYGIESDIDFNYDGAWENDYFLGEHFEELNDVARFIRDSGLTFDGNEWATYPDGSYISNFRTGERCEVSAHLYNFSLSEEEYIKSVVG